MVELITEYNWQSAKTLLFTLFYSPFKIVIACKSLICENLWKTNSKTSKLILIITIISHVKVLD